MVISIVKKINVECQKCIFATLKINPLGQWKGLQPFLKGVLPKRQQNYTVKICYNVQSGAKVNSAVLIMFLTLKRADSGSTSHSTATMAPFALVPHTRLNR